MSNVTLHIGGRDYMVACAEGEEAHVSGLGQMIESKLQSMGGSAHNEARQLLYAALLIADELFEAQQQLQAANAAAQAAPVDPIDPERLAAIAEKLENCASHLEGLAH